MGGGGVNAPVVRAVVLASVADVAAVGMIVVAGLERALPYAVALFAVSTAIVVFTLLRGRG